jgi:hypothetical protein
MPDTARREALSARSKALRDRATAFNDRLKDDRAKEFMRTTVFNTLDDVDGFFLGDEKRRPSLDMWERMWLDNAERMLAIAEQSFDKFEEQVKQYGGPENVRMYG